MNKIDYKQFYSALGKLLYAVADVDKVISPAEKKAIQKMIRRDLVPSEKHTDEFGTDVAFYAEIEFEILEELAIDSGTALQSFIDFIDGHRKLITPEMRGLCLRLAEKLATAYHVTNLKEQRLIATLKKKLEVR